MPGHARRSRGSDRCSMLLRLSRRERQIMEALYKLGRASAAEIHAAVPDPPSYTAIRTQLTLLEEKKHVTHVTEGHRFVYSPVVPREEMAQEAIEGVLRTFFDNSLELAITALMKRREARLSPEQIRRIETLIEEARRQGR